MKKLAFVFAVLAIASTACGNRNTADGTKDESGDKIISTVSNDNTKGGSIHLTKEVFLAQVWDYQNSPQDWNYKGDKPAIIDFYADWCAPCRMASPILEEVSKEYAGQVNVYKINTEKERELASVFGIQSIPAFLYIPVTGKPIMMSGVGRSKDETKKMFIENINKYLLITN